MRLMPPLLLAVLLAAPAAAQIVQRRHYEPVARPSPFLGGDSRGPRVGIGPDLHDTRRAIDADRAAGRIDAREARALKREAGLIARMVARYGRDGLSDAEADELEMRAAALRARARRP